MSSQPIFCWSVRISSGTRRMTTTCSTVRRASRPAARLAPKAQQAPASNRSAAMGAGRPATSAGSNRGVGGHGYVESHAWTR